MDLDIPHCLALGEKDTFIHMVHMYIDLVSSSAVLLPYIDLGLERVILILGMLHLKVRFYYA